MTKTPTQCWSMIFNVNVYRIIYRLYEKNSCQRRLKLSFIAIFNFFLYYLFRTIADALHLSLIISSLVSLYWRGSKTWLSLNVWLLLCFWHMYHNPSLKSQIQRYKLRAEYNWLWLELGLCRNFFIVFHKHTLHFDGRHHESYFSD